MARVLEGSHSFTCTPRVLTERSIPAFAFPAEAGTHTPIPEGWKAELAWEVGARLANGELRAADSVSGACDVRQA